MKRKPDSRRGIPTALIRGRRAEALAAGLLLAAGWRLLARNLRTRWIELDLLALDGTDLVAVEVKGRRGVAAPERCVSGPTQLRMRQALRALRPLLAPAARGLRVDVVAVTFADPLPPEVRHFRGLAVPAS